MAHRSEATDHYIEDMTTVFEVGDRVKAVVLKVSFFVVTGQAWDRHPISVTGPVLRSIVSERPQPSIGFIYGGMRIVFVVLLRVRLGSSYHGR